LVQTIIPDSPNYNLIAADYSWPSLVSWFVASRRDFPWRSNPHPYWVWVSEVMSQQTSLAVVLPFFNRFVETLPDVHALATADESLLRKLWQGLGYYSRLRNLQSGAQYICQQLDGAFPADYAGWLKVPGCGPYTAAAIASVCSNENIAAVDGNVVRVVARLLKLGPEVHSAAGRQTIRAMLNTVIVGHVPGNFNQSIMELGAVVCKPRKPSCDLCPLRSQCKAFLTGATAEFPVPKPRRAFVDVSLAAVAFVALASSEVALVQRSRGFLAQTTGFPLLDSSQLKELKLEFQVNLRSQVVRHVVTHHRMTISVFEVNLEKKADLSRARKWLDAFQFSAGFEWHLLCTVGDAVSSSLDRKVWRMLI
jgi:A/G-specific adenine glycosylase